MDAPTSRLTPAVRHLSRRTFVFFLLARETLGESEFFLKRLGRRFRAGARIETEQVPLFIPITVLPNVPFILGISGQREEGAGARLVPIRVALGSADLVQHTAFVEKDAPAAHDAEHGQSILAPAA